MGSKPICRIFKALTPFDIWIANQIEVWYEMVFYIPFYSLCIQTFWLFRRSLRCKDTAISITSSTSFSYSSLSLRVWAYIWSNILLRKSDHRVCWKCIFWVVGYRQAVLLWYQCSTIADSHRQCTDWSCAQALDSAAEKHLSFSLIYWLLLNEYTSSHWSEPTYI